MDFGAILLILAVALLVGVFISRPFFDRRFETQPLFTGQTGRSSDHDLSTLLAEKDHILTQLMDLDFDHAMGKTGSEEYPAQRALLVKTGAAVLRQLDELSPAPKAKSAPSVQGDDIEQMIAARRRELRRASGKEPRHESAGFCPKCGRPVQKDDRFCPKCGTVL